jgi:hypothetical protein
MNCKELGIEMCPTCKNGEYPNCYISSYIEWIRVAGFEEGFNHLKTFPHNAPWFLLAVEQGRPDKLGWTKKMLPLL